MKRRLAAAAVVVSALGILAAAPAQAAQVCVKAHVNINGNQQNAEQCLPE